MQEELISFETAKLAKEKEFNEDCRFHYEVESGEATFNPELEPLNNSEISQGVGKLKYPMISAPTQALLQRWLRKVHDIHVCPDIDLSKKWYVNIYNIKNKPSEFGSTYELLNEVRFQNYEEALEKGLLEALKLIK